ncbi:hypothetical protein BGZ63DRAFT_351405 [Mariannaea sp. PMI_226]|nr:hypothetical protein BGZ63DRAFT_351405 [Mariannaea sp. PMI_226]
MDHLSLRANFPTGQRDHSRSPSRQASRDERRETESSHRDDRRRYGREYDDRHGQYDQGEARSGGASRGAWNRDEHDYSGMYDDEYQGDGDYGREQHDDDRYDRSRSRYQTGHNRSPNRYNRSRSRSLTRDAGKPSDTIILEGLPFSISSSELRENLLNTTIAAELPSFDVRVSTSKGYRRAFVQFQEVDHAISFMREHYPKLFIELAHSTDDVPDGKINAYIHYARSREARDEMESRATIGGNWDCTTCDFSNYPTRTKCKICGSPQFAPNWQQNLTGLTDAADTPSQILVVYPLAPFVTEEMLANDLMRLEVEKPETTKDTSNGAPKLKSTAPVGNTAGYGARPGSLHRVFLMRNVNTDESFKYGFVEFWTLEDATAAMTKFQKSRSFTISACPVTVSNIHMGVFVPEAREVSHSIERMSFHPLMNPNIRVRYRDLHAYPSQQLVTSAPPATGDVKSTDETGDGKKSKKRKAEGGPSGPSTKKPVAMGGQLAVWQRKADELRKPGEGSADDVEKAQDKTPVRISLSKTASTAAGAKPQGPIKISISGTTKLGAPQDADAGNSTSATEEKPQSQSTSNETVVSYVDRERLMCLICMRKYKSVDEVDIHEKSRNHRNATENEEQVKAALPRLAARDKRLQKQAQENPDTTSSGSQYRDRAKERREAFNQPTKPAPGQQSNKAKQPPKPAAPEKPAKPAQSKGAGMLAKMGWSVGSGLGVNNDGRTEVVATNAYQEGVGLGADGGNLGDAAQLAERKTKNNYTDYLNTVQDKARERYNQMS